MKRDEGSTPTDLGDKTRRDLLMLISTAGVGAAALTGCIAEAGDESLGGAVQALGTNFDVHAVESIAQLRMVLDPATSVQVYVVLGHTDPDDGGGGTFYWHDNSEEPDDDALVVAATNNPSGVGRWLRLHDKGFINVKWFGAKGDDSNADDVAIQAAVDYFRLNQTAGTLFFPRGQYRITNTIAIPIFARGITFRGVGRTDGFGPNEGSVLVSAVTGQADMINTPTHVGDSAYFTFEDLSFVQVGGSTGGYFLAFNNNVSIVNVRRVYFQLDNTDAGFLTTNFVDVNGITIEDVSGFASGNGATVPLFHFRGQTSPGHVLSGIRMKRCRLFQSNDEMSTGTAPMVKLESGNGDGSAGDVFEDVVFQGASGGALHLLGIPSALLSNVHITDTADEHMNAPSILIDTNLGQGDVITTMINCYVTDGTSTYPGVKITNSVGNGPRALNVIGGRISFFDNSLFRVNIFGSNIGNYLGTRLPLRLEHNTVMGVEGICDEHSADMTHRAFNVAGTVQFNRSDTAVVRFDQDWGRNEPDANYRVVVTADANETIWLYEKTVKATGESCGFVLKSSENESVANVDWCIIRAKSPPGTGMCP